MPPFEPSALRKGALIVLVGPSGAGKSTFAAQNFDPDDVFSSDQIRHYLWGDFRDQRHPNAVFWILRERVEAHLMRGRMAVIDATNLTPRDRRPWVDMSVKFSKPLVYVVINRSLAAKKQTAGWRAAVPGLIERHDTTFHKNLSSALSGDDVAQVFDLRP